MANTRRQAAIAGRARRIGWKVETGDKGGDWLYRITRPNGQHVYLHATPSDTNWEWNVLRGLNGQRKQFEKAEQAWKAENEANRQAKAAAAQAAAEKKLAAAEKLAAQRSGAVNLAAGPYAVVEFDPAWLLTPHELPEVRRGILTPETAGKLLDTVERARETRHQRLYRSQRERDFIEIIESGDWGCTHQGIAIDTLGRMQDGQHRAGAIRTTGQPQEVYITVGLPPENFTKLDSPRPRTAKDALDIRGEVQTSAMSSAIRLILAFDREGSQLGGRTSRTRTKVTATAIDRFITGPEGPHIRDAVNRCMEIRKEIRIMASALTAGIYLIRRAAGTDSPRVVRFLEDLEIGVPDRFDAVYKLRKVINDNDWGRTGQFVTLALIIKAWNARAVDKPVKLLAWRSDESFPSTVIVPAPEVD